MNNQTDSLEEEKNLRKKIIQASKIVDLALKTNSLTQEELRDYIDLGLQLGLSTSDLKIIRNSLIRTVETKNLDSENTDNVIIESLTREKLISKFAELVSNTEESSLAQIKTYFIIGISLGLNLTSIEDFRNQLLLPSNG